MPATTSTIVSVAVIPAAVAVAGGITAVSGQVILNIPFEAILSGVVGLVGALILDLIRRHHILNKNMEGVLTSLHTIMHKIDQDEMLERIQANSKAQKE